jgi:hypothetical protein
MCLILRVPFIMDVLSYNFGLESACWSSVFSFSYISPTFCWDVLRADKSVIPPTLYSAGTSFPSGYTEECSRNFPLSLTTNLRSLATEGIANNSDPHWNDFKQQLVNFMFYCITNSHPHTVTNTKCHTDTVISPDD